MAARTDLPQYGRECLSRAWARRGDGRGTEDVHQVNHGDRSVCLGERRRHHGKRAGT